MQTLIRVLFWYCLLFFSSDVLAYSMDYYVKFVPKKNAAQVKLVIQNKKDKEGKRPVQKISFKNHPDLHSNIKANGRLEITEQRVTWYPPAGKAWIKLQANLLHQRDDGEYDSYINNEWAIFRGDDLFPPVRVAVRKGEQSEANLHFKLPKKWPYVNTIWLRDKSKVEHNSMDFIVDNPDRRFDRPVGWMIVGDIATRRDYFSEQTRFAVSGPQRESFEDDGVGFRRMEILTMLHFVWPEFKKVLPEQPANVLVVGTGKPMWRGGLSGPNSLFMHAGRPLVSENGTSTLLHELFHSLTRIRGEKMDDWIAEGLAEYYSIALLYRAGGVTQERRDYTFRSLEKRAKNVKTLRKRNSTGATTAKAVLVLRDLDTEIQSRSKGKYSLDDVVKELVKKGKVSLNDLQESTEKLLGSASITLKAIK